MPILLDKIPQPCKKLVAGDIMQPGPIKLMPVESMKNIRKALKTDHRAFPIVNQSNYLIGIIPRNFILVLLENGSFYDISDKDDDTQGSIIGIR
jgi:CBS-domain-containing membrane protein